MSTEPSRSSAKHPKRPMVALTGIIPYYCPLCGKMENRGDLCSDCGETVVACGYCPTCEAFWKEPTAAICPKHDLELEDTPPPLEPLGTSGQIAEQWVTVATYSHPNEANGPRIRLEAEGVTTFLDGERVAGSTLYQVATGGVRLQVPESLAATARILLNQTWTAPASDELDEDEDPWVGLAPVPGTRRRAIMKWAILGFLIGPGLLSLFDALARSLGWIR